MIKCFVHFVDFCSQEAAMEKVRITIKAGAPAAEIAAQLIGMIDNLVADCR